MTTPRETEEAKLLIEYQQLCDDWRSRDRYVLDKLGAAGILFGLLGVALGTIPPGNWLIKCALVFLGAFFSFILSVSVAKDTYYRDGTERLLRHLSNQLGISTHLQNARSQNVKYLQDIKDLEFLRKIETGLESYKKEKQLLPKWLMWLQNPLLKPATFKWILTFYVVSCFIFIIVLILIVFDYFLRWSLPF